VNTKRIATDGLLLALALILSFIDSLIPMPIPVAGIKLGLANLAVMAALCLLGPGAAAAVSLVRLLLSLFIFGNASAFLFSLFGASLSLAGMILLRRTGRFGIPGVSMAGAVLHNLGQLTAAGLLTGTAAVVSYLPVLLAAGTVTGLANGLVLAGVLRILKRTGIQP
jgi:heptaprenyl diphosphate synthase